MTGSVFEVCPVLLQSVSAAGLIFILIFAVLSSKICTQAAGPAMYEKNRKLLCSHERYMEADGMEQGFFYDITTFGEILIDFTCCGINGEGIALFAQNPGGAPANVAVAAGRLGARAAFIGKAGADMHGEYLRNVLKQNGVEAKGLTLDPDYFTTLAFVDISANGERSFSFARKPGADTRLHNNEVNEEILDRTKIFHLGSLSLTDEPSRTAALYAVERAKSKGCIVSYDPNYRASLWKNEAEAVNQMRSLIQYADVIKISEEEMLLLTDSDTPEGAAKDLLDQGVVIAAITLGEKGAFVACKDGHAAVPAFESSVLDTNGAGDAFMGGFLYQLSKREKAIYEVKIDELKKYACFGNAAASLCVERRGAIPAMPTLEEVNKRLQSV